jgi:hypothetical protein
MTIGKGKRHKRPEAAQFLTGRNFPTTTATLAAVARTCRGGGPPFTIFGRDAYYWEEDLLEWAEARVQHRGGQPAQPPRQKQAAA